jgi:putative protease
MKMPELLAPVNGPEGLFAALAAGADAVYLGLKEFNARRRAGNFTPDELEQAVRDCRRARCNVYLTFNTLVLDREWERAKNALGAAWEAGVDALIVQDLGVVRLVRGWLPGLPLHASTQMTVHHPSQLRPLARARIERVILARELTLEEVAVMAGAAKPLGMEVEVFAHGALCVSYSGQCLISAFMEGRSGNRGLCAQLCRRHFKVGGKRSLPLSMKDLSALPLLPGLVRAGVGGLKIEGRMKRPEYVAGVAAVYKEALVRIAGGSSGPFPDLEEELRLVFNRGFTTGGLENGFSADQTTGKWGGAKFVKVGTLVRHDRERQRLLVKLEHAPEPGDGVVLFPEDGSEPFTFIVTKLFGPETEGSWIGIKPLEGDCPTWGTLHLSSSARALNEIRSAIKTYEPPRIGVHLRLSGSEGESLKALASAEGGLEASSASTAILQQAGKRPLTFTMLEEQLGRLGNTPYRLRSLTWEGGSDLFLPMSDLNAMRRSFVERLEAQRTATRETPACAYEQDPAAVPADTKISVLCGARHAAGALDAGAARVYCPADDPLPGQWLWVPPITPFKLHDRIERLLESHPFKGVLAGHLGAASMAKRLGLPWWADTSFNITNGIACDEVREMGAAGAVVSWETDPMEGASLPLEHVVLGRPPVMQSGLKGAASSKKLIDDDQRRYPLKPWADGDGFTLEAPFFRLDLDGLSSLCGEIDFVRLDLRELPPASHAAVIQGVGRIMNDPSCMAEVRRKIEACLP